MKQFLFNTISSLARTAFLAAFIVGCFLYAAAGDVFAMEQAAGVETPGFVDFFKKVVAHLKDTFSQSSV